MRRKGNKTNEFNYTQEALAHTVGKSRSHIANLLRLLSLPEPVQQSVREGKLSMGHARALLGAKDIEALAKRVMDEALNVRQTETLAKGGSLEPVAAPSFGGTPTRDRSNQGGSGKSRGSAKDPDIIALEETLSENLGLSVSIEDKGDQSGTILLHYKNLRQLDEILQRLGDSI